MARESVPRLPSEGRNRLGSEHACLDHLIAANDEGLIADDELMSFMVIFEKSVALSSGYASYLVRTAKHWALTTNN